MNAYYQNPSHQNPYTFPHCLPISAASFPRNSGNSNCYNDPEEPAFSRQYAVAPAPRYPADYHNFYPSYPSSAFAAEEIGAGGGGGYYREQLAEDLAFVRPKEEKGLKGQFGAYAEENYNCHQNSQVRFIPRVLFKAFYLKIFI